MTITEEILFGIAFFLGNCFLYVASARIRTTQLMQNRVLNLADNLWREAVEANQTNDPCLLKLHNQLIELAAISPAISAAIVVAKPDKGLSKEERSELIDFLNRNAWTLPYIFTSFLALERLEFHAKPWRADRWFPALLAWFAMRFWCDKTGAVRLGRKPSEAASEIETFIGLDTRNPAEQLAAV